MYLGILKTYNFQNSMTFISSESMDLAKIDNFLKSFVSANPFLGAQRDQIEALFKRECDSDEERALMKSFMQNLTLVTQKKFSECLSGMVQYAENKAHISENRVLLVAICIDRDPDSSQSLVYSLKTKLGRSNYQHKIDVINSVNKVVEQIKRAKYDAVICVDEFLGSGATMKSRYEELLRRLNDAKLEVPSIEAYFLAASVVGIDTLSVAGLTTNYFYRIDKAIENHYGKDATQYEILKQICSGYSTQFGVETLNILGWGNTESLYAREEGNCPNNVLPIFWWRAKDDGTFRDTILSRYVGGLG